MSQDLELAAVRILLNVKYYSMNLLFVQSCSLLLFLCTSYSAQDEP
jgi:hypothetical protein